MKFITYLSQKQTDCEKNGKNYKEDWRMIYKKKGIMKRGGRKNTWN